MPSTVLIIKVTFNLTNFILYRKITLIMDSHGLFLLFIIFNIIVKKGTTIKQFLNRVSFTTLFHTLFLSSSFTFLTFHMLFISID